MNKLNDMVTGSLSVVPGSANVLLACLGSSLEDLLGLDLDKLFNDPSVDFSKYPGLVLDLLKDFISNTLGGVLGSAESAFLDALSAIESAIDTDQIDKLLMLFGCYQDKCDPPDNLPADLDIEQRMEDAGLKVTGEVDLGKSGLSDKQQEHFNSLRDAKSKLDDSVNDRVKKIF